MCLTNCTLCIRLLFGCLQAVLSKKSLQNLLSYCTNIEKIDASSWNISQADLLNIRTELSRKNRHVLILWYLNLVQFYNQTINHLYCFFLHSVHKVQDLVISLKLTGLSRLAERLQFECFTIIWEFNNQPRQQFTSQWVLSVLALDHWTIQSKSGFYEWVVTLSQNCWIGQFSKIYLRS